MSKAARVKVFPLVTACEEASAPVASRREFTVSLIAQCVAVPVPVTVPSLMDATVTRRPEGDRSAGEPTLREVLFPSVFVLVAAV